MWNVSLMPPALQFEKKHLKFAIDSFFIIVIAGWTLIVSYQMFNLLKARTSVYAIEKGMFQHVDFLNIYMAGKLALSEDRAKAYDPAVQLACYNKVIAPAKIDKCVYLQYPPYFFPLMIPVSLLPLRESYIVWNIVSVLFGLFGLSVAARTAFHHKHLTLFALCVGTVVSFPSCDSLLDGQFTWWLVGGISIFYWGLLRKKDLLCASLLAIMSIKPHFVIFLMVPVLLQKRWRLFAYTVGLVAALLVISGFMIGWSNLIVYPNILMHAEVTSAYAMVFPERMVSVRGPASMFLPTEAAFVVSFLALAVGLAIVLWCWWGERKKSFQPEWCIAITLLALLVTTPHVHLYDCVLIAIGAFLTLPSVLPSTLVALKPRARAVWSLLLFSYPLTSWILMTVVPPIGRSVITDPSWQQKLSVNEINCGLLTYYAYFVFDLLLLALAVMCVKHQVKEIADNQLVP